MARNANPSDLATLAQLRDSGVLTEKEFQEQKFAALNGRRPITAKRVFLGLLTVWFVLCALRLAYEQLGGGM